MSTAGFELVLHIKYFVHKIFSWRVSSIPLTGFGAKFRHFGYGGNIEYEESSTHDTRLRKSESRMA